MSGSSRPAQARPEGLRGAVAGRGPRQVPVVHDPGAGRLPAHRHRLDQHRHLVRAAEPQVPPPTAPSGSSPPVLVGMLRQHLHAFGTTPDERLFGAAAAACSANRSTAAPGPPPARPRSARSWPPLRSPAAPATCARRAVLVANASGEPAEVAARAGTSGRVLYEVYLHCIESHEDTVSQRIVDALDAHPSSYGHHDA